MVQGKEVESNWIMCLLCNKWRRLTGDDTVTCHINDFVCGNCDEIEESIKADEVQVHEVTDDTLASLIGQFIKSPSQFTWYQLWEYIRKGSTVKECFSRLDETARMYPSSGTYVTFLKRIAFSWCVCLSIWEETQGFEASSMMEGIHSTHKRAIGQQGKCCNSPINMYILYIYILLFITSIPHNT